MFSLRTVSVDRIDVGMEEVRENPDSQSDETKTEGKEQGST